MDTSKNNEKDYNNFKSMQDVDRYLDSIKGCNSDLYEAISVILGRGKQFGEAVNVENIGLIDKYIVSIVVMLNNKGFKTLASCSGIKSEHDQSSKFREASPYLSFKYDAEKAMIIKKISKKINANYEEGECFFQKSYCVRFNNSNGQLDDTKIKLLWDTFKTEIEKI